MPGLIITGSVGADTYAGGAGDDSISGADGADILSGGPGADTIDGGAGDDWLYSGDRSPPFNLPYYSNTYVPPLLDTGREVDNLQGGDGSDRISAGYGDNVDGGADGSYGDYLYISFQGAPSGVTADFRLATQTIGGGVITGIENVSWVQGSQYDDNLNVGSRGGGYSDFTVVEGMAGNDTLTAGYYTGTMFGDSGNDVVDGRLSQYLELVDGGDGNDTLYTNSNTFASANGGAGDDTIYAHGVTHGGAGNDTIVMQSTYYSGSVYGDDGDDQITAASTGNSMAGGAGADTITGSSGTDSLYSADFGPNTTQPADDAGLEHDRLSGGAGNDALAIGYGDDADGGPGNDTLRLSLAGLTHGIDFDTSGIVSGQPFDLGGGVIQNIETLLSLRGTDFADTLRLQTQNVLLSVDAGAGNDLIISQGSSVSVKGGAGDDVFVSGAAADTFDGGAGNDTVDYGGAASGVTVSLATGAGGGGDTLTGVEAVNGSPYADTLTGSNGADVLRGAAGDDSMQGGAGDDRLQGGAGADTMSGGAGYNVFEFGLAGDGAAASGLGGHLESLDRIGDWTSSDFLQFSGDVGPSASNYQEISAATYDTAYSQAQTAYSQAGIHYTIAQVGADLVVLAPQEGDAVILTGRTLSDISMDNLGPVAHMPSPPPPVSPPPVTPPPVTPPPVTPPPVTPPPVTPPPVTPPPVSPPSHVSSPGAQGTVAGNMDAAHLVDLFPAVLTAASSTQVAASGANGLGFNLIGSGFTYNNDQLDGGAATHFSLTDVNGAGVTVLQLDLGMPGTSVASFEQWLAFDQTQTAFGAIFSGDDTLQGGAGGDLIRSFSGDDSVSAGAGNDTLDGGAGANFLVGGDGDDLIQGGADFDRTNGNAGNDTVHGNGGDDWVTGGKDDDVLYGDAGNDILNGNLGNDTLSGGTGNDTVRGGQGDDLLSGGDGNDFITGDRGNDTMTGGAGADTFRAFNGGGADVVTDFHASEGDRIQLDPGTTYTVSQVGADTVINLGGGDKMTLQGVTLSTLPAGWIFGA